MYRWFIYYDERIPAWRGIAPDGERGPVCATHADAVAWANAHGVAVPWIDLPGGHALLHLTPWSRSMTTGVDAPFPLHRGDLARHLMGMDAYGLSLYHTDDQRFLGTGVLAPLPSAWNMALVKPWSLQALLNAGVVRHIHHYEANGDVVCTWVLADDPPLFSALDAAYRRMVTFLQSLPVEWQQGNRDRVALIASVICRTEAAWDELSSLAGGERPELHDEAAQIAAFLALCGTTTWSLLITMLDTARRRVLALLRTLPPVTLYPRHPMAQRVQEITESVTTQVRELRTIDCATEPRRHRHDLAGLIIGDDHERNTL